jgi:hypothetical protein
MRFGAKRIFLGQRLLTISHSLGLEAVASHHPEPLMGLGEFIYFARQPHEVPLEPFLLKCAIGRLLKF